jgi:hypothetical protein
LREQRELCAYRIRFNSVAVRAAVRRWVNTYFVVKFCQLFSEYFRPQGWTNGTIGQLFGTFWVWTGQKTSSAQTAQSPTNPHLKHANSC